MGQEQQFLSDSTMLMKLIPNNKGLVWKIRQSQYTSSADLKSNTNCEHDKTTLFFPGLAEMRQTWKPSSEHHHPAPALALRPGLALLLHSCLVFLWRGPSWPLEQEAGQELEAWGDSRRWGHSFVLGHREFLTMRLQFQNHTNNCPWSSVQRFSAGQNQGSWVLTKKWVSEPVKPEEIMCLLKIERTEV